MGGTAVRVGAAVGWTAAGAVGVAMPLEPVVPAVAVGGAVGGTAGIVVAVAVGVLCARVGEGAKDGVAVGAGVDVSSMSAVAAAVSTACSWARAKPSQATANALTETPVIRSFRNG